jgi:hypothetical protein
MHDRIHAKSGQDLPLKLQYIRTEKEAVMGWVCLGPLLAWEVCSLQNLQITQPFEMYIAVSQGLPKSAVISAANAVARWVKKGRRKTFLEGRAYFLVQNDVVLLYTGVCIH